jgi:hypothetical protein
MSNAFDHLNEALPDLDQYKGFIDGIGEFLEGLTEHNSGNPQDEYDNRVKATLAAGIAETNILLHDIALSLRVLSGRDKDA